MAVAFRSGADTGNLVEVSALNVPVPAGSAVGDVAAIYLTQWNPNTPVITPPSGFVQKGATWNSTDTNAKNSIWWKRLTAADAGNYAFSWTGGTMWSGGACALFTGCIATGDPWDAIATPTVGTWGNPTSISVTMTDPAGGLFWAVYNDSAGTHTPPTSFTEFSDFDSGAAAYWIPGSAGSKSASGATISSSSPASQWLGALLSDGAAGGAVSDPPSYQFPAPGRRGPGSRAFGWFGTGDDAGPAAPSSIAEVGTAPVGTTTSAQTVKVAAVSGVTGVGTAARTGAAKVMASSGTTSAGTALSSVARKLGVTRGSAAAGPVASSTTAKRGVTVGSAPVGTATGAATRKLATTRGLTAVGTVAGSAAVKRGVTVGLAAVGSAATISRALTRAVSAVMGVGAASAATVAKRAATAGSASTGPALTSAPRKLAVTRGVATVGTVTLRSGVVARAISAVMGVGSSVRAVVVRRAAVTGTAATGPVARATAGRRASVAAVAGIGPATLASAARRAAVAALSAVATVLSWNKSLGAPKTQVRAGTPYSASSSSVAGVPLDATGAPEPGPPAGA